jgi:hypothetical protein
MEKYSFETSEFGISQKGFHLLRSGFNYETIEWTELNSVKFYRGKELYNWWIILLIGIGLLILGIYLSFRTFDILLHKENPQNYAKMLLFCHIPMIGIYFISNAIKTGTLLKINYASYKKKVFPLRQIEKAERLAEFKLLVNDETRKALC